jgi:hypothetical protein
MKEFDITYASECRRMVRWLRKQARKNNKPFKAKAIVRLIKLARTNNA